MIGVAISTHRRPTVLARALAGWALHMPDVLVVVHDINGDGVAVTKNRCLTALMDLGVDQLFLADDDVWPVAGEWWRPYVDLPAVHAMHCWGKRRYLHTEDGCTVWSWPRGVVLYVQRHVVDKVGGMRTEFHNAGEHAEWSRRIHNCGFTKHPFQDAAAAKQGVWHCLDYNREVPSTLPASRYDVDETNRRHELYETYRRSTDFVEYR